jgi:threonine efflux protein
MDIAQWLTLAGICLLGAMSPGPSLVVVLSSTVSGGSRSGFVSAIAHGAGVGLYGLLTVTGLALLITQSPSIFLALQLGGALYLVWLGGKSLLACFQGSSEITGGENTTGQNAATRGFLVAFLNPKLAVFMLALFSQLLRPEYGLHEKAIMVVTVGAIDAAWYSLAVILISHPGFKKRLLSSSRLVDGVFGVILLGLACSVFLSAIAT